MNFKLIGVNHQSAPLEVRERLAVPEDRLPEAVRTLVEQPGVEEGMVLSTWNRVELLTRAKESPDLQRLFGIYFGGSGETLHSHVYYFVQRDCERPVFR